MIISRSLFVCPCLLLAFLVSATAADDPVTAAPKVAPDAKAPQAAADSEHRLAFPSPYARLAGIEAALQKQGAPPVKWADLYQRLAKKNLKPDALGDDRATLAFAIGVRLADAVIALMAKDEEKLLLCAKDARACAQKLGIKKTDIGNEGTLLRSIEDGEWKQVFFELGMIQQEIISRLENNTPSQKDRSITAMVASGAWLQGVRYAVDVISDNMKVEDLSNTLRAAPLAARLKAELEKAPPEVAALPATKKSIEVLDQVRQLIDIKRDETIPKEKLLQIQQMAAGVVAGILP